MENPDHFSRRESFFCWPSVEEGQGTGSAFGTVEAKYKYDAPADQTELLWKCLRCGELKPRNKWVLGPCPSCGAPKSQFVLVDED